MNARKPIAVVAAMLITAAGMAGIANYGSGVAAPAHEAVNTNTAITTLPTITVRPSREQLRELRSTGNKAKSASASSADVRMPFYSFASDAAGA
jgi:hypothetical protein